MTRLVLKKFAHIREATLEFGDLTLLVGAQGTGKSLVLQWLKTAIDGRQIVEALRGAGQEVEDPKMLIDLIFGVGMGSSWRRDTVVELDDASVRPENLAKRGDGVEHLFYIPAHRAMLISDGWAMPFQKLTAETPVVARLFSQNLFDRFSRRAGDKLFPLRRVLKGEYRKMINDAVFHGGAVAVQRDAQHAKRLRLTHGSAELPFMTWTAGQREFTPLLLGLYHLLPERRKKVETIDWVVIEEPEMGLHPRAIRVFMMLALELLWRGYRVVVSTHSPVVLAAVWMLQQLREQGGDWHKVCDAFEVDHAESLKRVAKTALTKDLRTYLLRFSGDVVVSRDISSLDPDDADEEVSGWGGLTGIPSRFAEAVREAANERAGR